MWPSKSGCSFTVILTESITSYRLSCTNWFECCTMVTKTRKGGFDGTLTLKVWTLFLLHHGRNDRQLVGISPGFWPWVLEFIRDCGHRGSNLPPQDYEHDVESTRLCNQRQKLKPAHMPKSLSHALGHPCEFSVNLSVWGSNPGTAYFQGGHPSKY